MYDDVSMYLKVLSGVITPNTRDAVLFVNKRQMHVGIMMLPKDRKIYDACMMPRFVAYGYVP